MAQFLSFTLQNTTSLFPIPATITNLYSYPPIEKQNRYSVACTRVKLPSSAVEILNVSNTTDYVIKLVNRFDRTLAGATQGSATKSTTQPIPLSSVIQYFDEDTLLDVVNKTISQCFYNNLLQGNIVYYSPYDIGCVIDKYTSPVTITGVNYNSGHSTVTFEDSTVPAKNYSPTGANATSLRYVTVTIRQVSIFASGTNQLQAGTYSLYLTSPSGNKVVFYEGDLADPNDLFYCYNTDVVFADFGLISSKNLNSQTTGFYYPTSSFFLFNTTDPDIVNGGTWKFACLFKANLGEPQPFSATFKYSVNFITTLDQQLEVYAPTFSFETDGRISFNYEDRYTMSNSQLYLSPGLYEMLKFPLNSRYNTTFQMYQLIPGIIADINFSSLGTMYKTTQRISTKYLLNNISRVTVETPNLCFNGELTSNNKVTSNVLCDFLIDDTANLTYLVYTTDASVRPQKAFKLTSPDTLRQLTIIVNIQYNNGLVIPLQIPPLLSMDLTLGFYLTNENGE